MLAKSIITFNVGGFSISVSMPLDTHLFALVHQELHSLELFTDIDLCVQCYKLPICKLMHLLSVLKALPSFWAFSG